MVYAEFGFGKKSMEGIISEEAAESVQHLVSRCSEGPLEFKVDQPFNTAIFNILWRIVAGKRYEVS